MGMRCSKCDVVLRYIGEEMETKTEIKELSFESIENVVMSAIDGFHESLAQAQTEYLEEHNAPFSYAYDCNEFRMQALIEVKKLIKTAFREQLRELQNKKLEEDRFGRVDDILNFSDFNPLQKKHLRMLIVEIIHALEDRLNKK